MSSDGNPGAAYDMLISSAALVPLSGGGLSLGASGEIVNLNTVGASFISLNAGLPGLVSFETFQGANFPGATGGAFSIPFSLGGNFCFISSRARLKVKTSWKSNSNRGKTRRADSPYFSSAV